MATFDFISGEDFRASLEADYRELGSCLQASAYKAACVLAGSIIEAVLIDYLIAIDYKKQDPLKMDLNKAISACEEEGILSQKTVGASNAIRSYRNLIHPGRSVRLGEVIDENGAKIAQALVEIIVGEISTRKKETYGYTAEEIVSKLERDSSAVAILGHLLKGANQFEIERLLLRAIPQRYFELKEDIEPEFPSPGYGEYLEYLENTLLSLEKCFRSAFDIASDEVKRKVMKRFLSILKEEDEHKVLAYETAFFRGNDLTYLSSEEAQLIKEHLLSRLREGVHIPLLQAMEGLGQFLTADEIRDFADPIIRTILRERNKLLEKKARECIENEYWRMKGDVQGKLRNRLDDWIAHLEGKMEPILADTIRDLVKELELPF